MKKFVVVLIERLSSKMASTSFYVRESDPSIPNQYFSCSSTNSQKATRMELTDALDVMEKFDFSHDTKNSFVAVMDAEAMSIVALGKIKSR